MREPGTGELWTGDRDGAVAGSRPAQLVAERIDLPQPGELKEFDPARYLCPSSIMFLEQPDSLLLPIEDQPPGLPKGRLANRTELF